MLCDLTTFFPPRFLPIPSFAPVIVAPTVTVVTRQAVVRDGVARGIESVRRSDSWQMSHGVGAEDGNVRGRISTVEADGRVDGALQAGAGPGGELSATGGRGESREMLLRALGTAEVRGGKGVVC